MGMRSMHGVADGMLRWLRGWRHCIVCEGRWFNHRSASHLCPSCRTEHRSTACLLRVRTIGVQSHHAREGIAKLERMAVYRRDNWTCWLCECEVDRSASWPSPDSPSIDHVVPVVRGGSNHRNNLRCAHLGCNIRKRDKVLFHTVEGGHRKMHLLRMIN